MPVKNIDIAIAGNDHCICIHHWLLERPNGETSKGTCKLCGTERSFYNTPDYMREDGNQWMRTRDADWREKQRVDSLATKANSESD